MLVETMTPEEITREIFTDLKRLRETSIERIGVEYERTRRRLKVKKDATFYKIFEIKSHNKNKWMLFLSKAPSVEKFRNLSDTNILELTYYYTTKGLRVFKPIPSGGLTVYNGHLFNRYNERMNLGIIEPMEKVRNFFINNGYANYQIIKKDDKQFTVGTCKDGLLLGELKNNWVVNNTFITKDLMYLEQDEIEASLIDSLKSSIMKELSIGGKGSYNYNYYNDVIKGITK